MLSMAPLHRAMDNVGPSYNMIVGRVLAETATVDTLICSNIADIAIVDAQCHGVFG